MAEKHKNEGVTVRTVFKDSIHILIKRREELFKELSKDVGNYYKPDYEGENPSASKCLDKIVK